MRVFTVLQGTILNSYFLIFFRNLKNNQTCLRNVSKARKETYYTQVTRVGLGGKWLCSILGIWRESIYWFSPGYSLSRLTPIRHVQQVCNINTGQTGLRLQQTRPIPNNFFFCNLLLLYTVCAIAKWSWLRNDSDNQTGIKEDLKFSSCAKLVFLKHFLETKTSILHKYMYIYFIFY